MQDSVHQTEQHDEEGAKALAAGVFIAFVLFVVTVLLVIILLYHSGFF